MEEILGEILEIIFLKEETNFAIVKIKDSKMRIIKVTGNIRCPLIGAKIKMNGFWENHPRYGNQFKVIHSEISIPDNVYGIRNVLGSGLAQGIGPAAARRIVAFFGAETIDIMNNDIEKLLLVPGIGLEKFRKIQSAWNKQKK